MSRLSRNFFNQNTLIVAQKLLGKYLIRDINGNKLVGKIVETEAYVGKDDLACHASKGKTERTKIMFGESGHAYVYMIYGMYFCLNIVTEKDNFPAAVLIRALEPIEEEIKEIKTVRKKPLSDGPGKLCRWMKIDKSLNGIDLIKSNILYIENKEEESQGQEIVKSKRVGVDYAKHCKDYLWRFYIKDNLFVSKK